MRFILQKKGRIYRGGIGYTGPACITAGVAPGRIYSSRIAAESVAKLLTSINSVGFDVLEYRDLDRFPPSSCPSCSE